MEYIVKGVNIRKDQDKALVALSAQLQLERGKSVSISELVREALDVYLADSPTPPAPHPAAEPVAQEA